MSAPLPSVSPTLSQPYIPGVNGNAGAADVTALDPKYRPERTDNLTVSLQRQINKTMSMEVGYIGRIIRNELLPINLDSVPYMTTLGGQTFANAFSQIYFPVNGRRRRRRRSRSLKPLSAAPTRRLLRRLCQLHRGRRLQERHRIKNTAVSDLWTALYKAPGWTLGRSLVAQPLPGSTTSQGYTYLLNTALGFGNYNALFITHHIRDFHGITATSNFTWGRALGTGTTSQATSSNTAMDNYNLQNNYGPQSFDVKFIYNVAMYYSPKVFQSQKGIRGQRARRLDLLAAVHRAERQPHSARLQRRRLHAIARRSAKSAPPLRPPPPSPPTRRRPPPTPAAARRTTTSPAPTASAPPTRPASTCSPIRPRCSPSSASAFSASMATAAASPCAPFRAGTSISASTRPSMFREGMGADFSFQFTNVMNHVVMGNPTLTITTPSTFGRITSHANTPRNMEFGLRLHF